MPFRKLYQKNNFLGGEVSPLVDGRSDIPQYQIGCQKLRNFISLVGGGATRRPGTRYVDRTGGTGGGAQTEAHSRARLVEFVISESESYIIEFSSNNTLTTCRIFTNSPTPTVVTTLYTQSSYTGVGFFDTTEIMDFQYVSIGRFIIFTHPSHKPFLIGRETLAPTFAYGFIDTVNGLSNAIAYNKMPYLPPNTNGITFTPNLVAATTITASAAYFSSYHIGAWIMFNSGICQITGWTSTTVVSVNTVVNFGGVGAFADWLISAWNGVDGYPRAIGVYNQRLVMGGTITNPDTIWLTQTNDYGEFYNGATGASDPKAITLASDQFNAIQWISGGKKLFVGTTGGEWIGVVEVTSGGELNVDFKQETSHGSSHIQSKRNGYSVNFVARSKQAIRELAFNFDNDSYVATNINILASHIASESDADSIIQVAWQEAPFQCLWAITTNGKLFGFTRDRQNQIASWHSHTIGGTYGTGPESTTYSVVESICVAPGPNNLYQRLYMIVKRTVNGSTVRWIEWMDKMRDTRANIDPGSSITACYLHMDGVVYQNSVSSTSTITGMTHVSSSNVYVVAKNTSDYGVPIIVHAGELAVNGSGVITIPNSLKGNDFFIGYVQKGRINTLPQDGAGIEGQPVYAGSMRRVDDLYIRLKDTHGLRVGQARLQHNSGVAEVTYSNLEPVSFYDDTAIGLQTTFSGVKTVKPAMTYDQDSGVALATEDPWPCTILSITSRMMVNEI